MLSKACARHVASGHGCRSAIERFDSDHVQRLYDASDYPLRKAE
jgi:hypothetical protein